METKKIDPKRNIANCEANRDIGPKNGTILSPLIPDPKKKKKAKNNVVFDPWEDKYPNYESCQER